MSDSPEYLTPAEFDLIQPLARELFAPFDSSRDDLVQSALATLAILQDNLKRDYAYQFVEFRDKRKLETILDSCDREIGRGKEKPKWEMTRSQVEELKQHRKSLKLASKEADLALGKDLLKEHPPSLLRSLYEPFFLTRQAQEAIQPRPLPDLEFYISRTFSPPSLGWLEAVNVDKQLYTKSFNTKELLSSKLPKSRDEMNAIRRLRKGLLDAFKGSSVDIGGMLEGLRVEIATEDETLETSLAAERSPSPERFPVEEIPKSPSPAFDQEGDGRSIGTVKPEKHTEQLQEQTFEEGADLVPCSSTSPSQKCPSTIAVHKVPSAPDVTHRDTMEAEMDDRLPDLRTAARLNLPSLDLVPNNSVSFFFPSTTIDASNLVAPASDLRFLSLTSDSSDDLALERTVEERDRERELRRAARNLREDLISRPGPGLNLVECFGDGFKTAPGGEEPGSTAHEENEEEDPFELLNGLRSTAAASDRQMAVVDTRGSESETRGGSSTLTPEKATTSPPLSSSRPSEPVFSTSPPPYTVYKRRSVSEPPAVVPFVNSADEAGSSIKIEGRTLEIDEFGFVEAEFEHSSSPSLSDSAIKEEEGYWREDAGNAGQGAQDKVRGTAPEKGDAKEPGGDLHQNPPNPHDGDLASASKPSQVASPEVPSADGRTDAVPLPSSSMSAPTFQTSTSLDRFLQSRGRHESGVQNSSPFGYVRSQRTHSSDLQARSKVAQPNPSPPHASTPFPLPAFLSAPPLRRNDFPLRVVIFDSLLQLRTLCSALREAQFELAHRPSRFPYSRLTVDDPHLITSGTSCVFFFKLIDLIGNAVRDDPPDSPQTRQEAISTTLRRFSCLYDRILVVFEEQQATRKGSLTKSYTPPVLDGLAQLSEALDNISAATEGNCEIVVVCSRGPEHSAGLTKKFTEYVEREEQKAPRAGPGAWGSRTWLSEDPEPDETPLLARSSSLNEMSACAILSVTTLTRFCEMPYEQFTARFADVCGSERLSRIYFDLHPDELEHLPSHTREPTPCIPPPARVVPQDDQFFRQIHSVTSEASDPVLLRFEDVFDVEKYEQEGGTGPVDISLLACDLVKACEQVASPGESLALRLSSSLLSGIARVYQQQFLFFSRDVTHVHQALKKAFTDALVSSTDLTTTVDLTPFPQQPGPKPGAKVVTVPSYLVTSRIPSSHCAHLPHDPDIEEAT
ncbi:hypothetical protein JCM16303_000356 [Sporobolomyces ruberrimus]